MTQRTIDHVQISSSSPSRRQTFRKGEDTVVRNLPDLPFADWSGDSFLDQSVRECRMKSYYDEYRELELPILKSLHTHWSGELRASARRAAFKSEVHVIRLRLRAIKKAMQKVKS